MRNLWINNSGGSISVIILTALVIISFAGLLFSSVKIYTDIKSHEQEAIVTVTETSVKNDAESQKAIMGFRSSLDRAIKEGADLQAKLKKATHVIDTLRKGIREKEAQVALMMKQAARREKQTDDEKALTQARIDKLENDKKALKARMGEGKTKFEELRRGLTKEITTLNMRIEAVEAEKQKLNSTIDTLRKGSLATETAKMHFNLANYFLESKKYEDAIKEYKRALVIEPNDADTHYNLALLYDMYTSDQIAALEHYNRCLELNPGFKNAKIRKSIKERVVELSLEEATKVSPTMAKQKNRHKLVIDRIDINSKGMEGLK